VRRQGRSATNTETNIAASTLSNQDGNYQIPFLNPGDYNVMVDHPGFKKAERQGIRISVNSQVALDFSLDIGAASETVNVTGTTPLLNATDADLGQVINSTYLSEVGIDVHNGRNVHQSGAAGAGRERQQRDLLQQFASSIQYQWQRRHTGRQQRVHGGWNPEHCAAQRGRHRLCPFGRFGGGSKGSDDDVWVHLQVTLQAESAPIRRCLVITGLICLTWRRLV
jgi:hypothetical protein